MRRFQNEINILKSLALVMVLLQHSLTVFQDLANMFFSKIPYSTNSVVFMYISGYLYGINREKYKEKGTLIFLKSKSIQLVIPYFFWTILLFGVVYIANQIPILSDFVVQYGYAECSFYKYFVGILTNNYIYAEHFWYIYYLFIIFMLCATFMFFRVGWRGLLVVLSCYVIVAQVGTKKILFTLLKMIVIFLMGQVTSENSVFRLHNKKLLFVSLMIFLLTFADIHYLKFVLIEGIRALEDLVLIWTSIIIMKEFSYVLAKIPSICRIASWVTKRSYCIYLSHNPYFVGVVAAFGKMIGIPAVLCIILSIVTGILGPSVIYMVAKRSYISSVLMFGESNE